MRPNIRICDPTDPLEREADQVSEHVRSAADNASNTAAAKATVPRGWGVEAGAEAGVEAPSIVHSALKSAGEPLSGSIRGRMEKYFGHDFSRVRIHADPIAAQSAQSVQALAYTVGHEIVMGANAGAPDTSLLAHELTHVVQHDARNRYGAQSLNRTPAILNRHPPGAGTPGGGGTRRIVFLDNDVLGELAGGNKRVADAFNKMRGDGADIRVGSYVYQQASQGKDRALAGARIFIVQQLNITVDNVGASESPKEAYEWFQARKIQVEPLDAPVVSRVRAAGPGAELWSLDGGVVQAARQAGVKPARESFLRHGDRPTPDVRAGLTNVGLGAWDITAEGQPIRRPVTPPGQAAAGKPGGAKSPSVAATTPKAETASGTIESSGTRDPGGGRGPGGGSGPGGSELGTTAHTGERLQPVNEPAPANHGTMVEGFLLMIHEKQFANLQQNEVDKFQRELDSRMHTIEALQAEGKDVAVTLIVEKQAPNLLHDVISEPGDLIRFHAIRIDDNPWWVNADPALNAQAREAARQGTLEQQIKAQKGDRFPMEPAPPKGWHYESFTQVLKSTKPQIEGTYRAVGVVKMFSGSPELAQLFGLERTLFVHHTRFQMLDIEMRSGTVKAPRPEPQGHEQPPSVHAVSDAPRSAKADRDAFIIDAFSAPSIVNGQKDGWSGVFTRGTPGALDSYRLRSTGQLFQSQGKAMILERVEGEDLDPQWSLGSTKWEAAILWERL